MFFYQCFPIQPNHFCKSCLFFHATDVTTIHNPCQVIFSGNASPRFDCGFNVFSRLVIFLLDIRFPLWYEGATEKRKGGDGMKERCMECGALVNTSDVKNTQAYYNTGMCPTCRDKVLRELYDSDEAHQMKRIADALERLTDILTTKKG